MKMFEVCQKTCFELKASRTTVEKSEELPIKAATDSGLVILNKKA